MYIIGYPTLRNNGLDFGDVICLPLHFILVYLCIYEMPLNTDQHKQHSDLHKSKT